MSFRESTFCFWDSALGIGSYFHTQTVVDWSQRPQQSLPSLGVHSTGTSPFLPLGSGIYFSTFLNLGWPVTSLTYRRQWKGHCGVSELHQGDFEASILVLLELQDLNVKKPGSLNLLGAVKYIQSWATVRSTHRGLTAKEVRTRRWQTSSPSHHLPLDRVSTKVMCFLLRN